MTCDLPLGDRYVELYSVKSTLLGELPPPTLLSYPLPSVPAAPPVSRQSPSLAWVIIVRGSLLLTVLGIASYRRLRLKRSRNLELQTPQPPPRRASRSTRL